MTTNIITIREAQRVLTWARNKGIFGAGDVEAQKTKFLEEALEYHDAHTGADAELEMGDVLVTILINAYMRGFDLDRCLRMAMDKNESRTGRMVNGVFVKDTKT